MITDDFDPELCLCQGKVPAEKRIDIEEWELHEKSGRMRWKTKVRYHQDCPYHGTNRGPDDA